MPASGVNGEDFDRLAAAMRKAGPELRKETLAGIRKMGKPVVVSVKARGLATIPSRGGLAKRIAGSGIVVKARASTSRGVGVSIAKTSSRGRIAAFTLDASGTFRHPVWGNREVWVAQSAPGAKGWFTDEITQHAPQFRAGIIGAMENVAETLANAV